VHAKLGRMLSPWKWELIDWLRTAGLAALFTLASALFAYAFSRERGAVIIHLRGAGRSRRVIFSKPDWPLFGQLWVMAFTALSGGAVVCGAIGRAGLYAETTAAWLQAIGSVLAILATLFVANYAARKDERARRRAMQDAFAGRVVAVSDLRKAFARAAEELRATPSPPNVLVSVPPPRWNEILAAEAAVAALLSHPAEIGPQALQALTRAYQTGGHWRASVGQIGHVLGQDVERIIRTLEEAAAEVGTIEDEAMSNLMGWVARG
jgi:hypothetical protein